MVQYEKITQRKLNKNNHNKITSN